MNRGTTACVLFILALVSATAQVSLQKTGEAITDRISKRSIAPSRRKTHSTTVDVTDLVGVGSGRGASGVLSVVGDVIWAWRPRYARVMCEDAYGKSVGVRVYEQMGDGEWRAVWCGWSSALHHNKHGDAPWCWVSLPQLRERYGAHRQTLRLEAEGDAVDSTLTFVVERVHELSMARLVVYLLGALSYAYAPMLALSTAFHLTAGSLGCIMLSAIVVLFILWRNLPFRKSLVAMATMWGGAAALVWKFVIGAHSNALDGARLQELFFHPLMVAYVVVSGLVGLAATYYVHDAGNAKMNRIVQVALQLGGVSLMMGSATTWVGGVFWCAAVVMVTWYVRQSGHAGRERPALRVDIPCSFRDQSSAFVEKAANTPGSRVAGGSLTRDGELDGVPSTPTVFQVSTTRGVPPSPTDFPESEQGRLHSLVRRGKVLNVETDRTIAIGKSKYNELFLKGYEVDFERGTITPPSKRRPQDFR